MVEFKSSKADQGNAGNHYQERNFVVYSELYPKNGKNGMGMELTRNTHMKYVPDRPFTVTACFKEQADDLRLLEA